MTHPAGIIVFGVVVAAVAIITYFAHSSGHRKERAYGRGRGSGDGSRHRPPSPPPSPPPSSARRRERRRRSPEKRSNSPVRASAASNELRRTCGHCGESGFVKINPCDHESLCRGCLKTHLEDNNTCPDCHGRIDSCQPSISPFGKCKSCRKFTKLFKFLDCNHSLSLCIKCFEEKNERYKNCPECIREIRGSDPKYSTSGVCGVCQEFTRFAMFQPCGHGNFCRRHALQYLESNGEECSECGREVTNVA